MKVIITVLLIVFSLQLFANPKPDANSGKVCYSIPKMHCQGCVDRISEEIESVSGVTGVSIDLKTKVATVIVKPGFAASSKIVDASMNAGYPASKVPCESDPAKKSS